MVRLIVALLAGGLWGGAATGLGIDANSRAYASETPRVGWNTFLGGSEHDEAYAIDVDDDGNSYVAGRSDTLWGSPVSSTLPTFVAKLSSTGSILWHTFIPASFTHGIAVDADHNVYVAGYASASFGNPLLPLYSDGLPYDAYVAKLSPTGELVWNTFLGGFFDDHAFAIAVDPDGNVTVAGYSECSIECGDYGWGNPIQPYEGDSPNAFVTRLNPDGTLA